VRRVALDEGFVMQDMHEGFIADIEGSLVDNFKTYLPV